MSPKMAWDPSQPPSPPRFRTVSRNIAPPNIGLQYFADPPSPFTNQHVAAILATLPGEPIARPVLEHFIVQLSRVYLGRLRAPPPPLAELRYAFRLAAHLTWEMENIPWQFTENRRRLSDFFGGSHRVVIEQLMDQIMLLTDEMEASRSSYLHWHYLTGDRITTIHRAAMNVEAKLPKRGDYSNDALKRAIALLIFVYDVGANSFPTFSRAIASEGGDGSSSTVVKSPGGKFILEYFARLDPNLPARTITNKLNEVLTDFRKGEKQGRRYFEKLANLL